MTSRHLLLLLVSAVSACERHPPIRRPGEPDVIPVNADDSKMNLAIERSRATLDSFVAHLQAPGTGETDFSVKARFDDGKQVEHIWLTNPRIADDSIRGVIGYAPDQITIVKEGQHVTVSRAQVTDWMFVRGGVLPGGFTIRALRAEMSARERAAFDAALPFKIR